METLGPLLDLAPEATTEHLETWSLHRNIQLASLSEEEIERVIQPLF
jgi:3-methyladenine DNA glycosylase AlkC